MGLLCEGTTCGTCLTLILKADVRYLPVLMCLLLYLCSIVRSYAITDVKGVLTMFHCQATTTKFPSLKILKADDGIRNCFCPGW